MTPRGKGYFYSKLSSAQECLRKYRYQYIDAIEPEASKSGDLEFGSAMHAGLGAYLTGNDGIAVFDIYWQQVKGMELKYGRFDHAALGDMGRMFLERFKKLHLKNFEVIKQEERMYATVDGVALEGTADVLCNYKGVLTLMDFKTSRSEYSKDMLICNPQLYIYSKLAKEVYGIMPTQIAYMVFIKSEGRIQTLISELTEEKLGSMIDNVLSQCRRLDTEREFPMNTKSCLSGSYRCQFWEVCYGNKVK